MKRILLLLLVLTEFAKFANAQDSILTREVIFKATLKDTANNVTNGYLYLISDSSVSLTMEIRSLRFSNKGLTEGKVFPFINIKKLRLQRKGSAGSGALIGSIIGGLGFGIAEAAAASNYSSTGWDVISPGAAFAGGLLVGGGVGALIGACVGALSHKTFMIQGKKERFDEMRKKMITRLAKNNNNN